MVETMNREERRKAAKKNVALNKLYRELSSNLQGMNLAELVKSAQEDDALKDGDQVKLNLQRIQGRQDYKRMQKEYKAFVEAHKDDIFTVKLLQNERYPAIVTFYEDDTWHFWSGDLRRMRTEGSE